MKGIVLGRGVHRIHVARMFSGSILIMGFTLFVATADAAGWILIMPPGEFGPDGRYTLDTNAPKGSWTQGGAYDTAAACERERSRFIRDGAAKVAHEGASSPLFNLAATSLCVPTDDPRLR